MSLGIKASRHYYFVAPLADLAEVLVFVSELSGFRVCDLSSTPDGNHCLEFLVDDEGAVAIRLKYADVMEDQERRRIDFEAKEKDTRTHALRQQLDLSRIAFEMQQDSDKTLEILNEMIEKLMRTPPDVGSGDAGVDDAQ